MYVDVKSEALYFLSITSRRDESPLNSVQWPSFWLQMLAFAEKNGSAGIIVWLLKKNTLKKQ